MGFEYSVTRMRIKVLKTNIKNTFFNASETWIIDGRGVKKIQTLINICLT